MIIFFTPIAWFWYFYNSMSYFLVYRTLEFYIPEDGHLACSSSMYIQGVPGGMCQTSGECSLC